MSNQLICGDCLEVMKTIPDGSVSMTLTSSPYEDARLYKPIEFTAFGQDWVDWMIPRVKEMCRVTAGLVFVNMAGKRKDWKYSPVVEWLVADLTRQHGIVCGPAPYVYYRVGIPGSGSKKYHRRDWEPVYAFAMPEHVPPKWSDNTVMGHVPKYAPGGEMDRRRRPGEKDTQSRRKSSGDRVRDGLYTEPETPDPGNVIQEQYSENQVEAVRKRTGNFRHAKDGTVKGSHDRDICDQADPGNVIEAKYTAGQVAGMIGEAGDVIHCSVGGGVMGDHLCHENEAPFSEHLVEFFIRSYCPEGGVVMDPFCGSGTTCKVAQRWGRKYLGIDVRQSQVGLSKDRLNSFGMPLLEKED